MQFPWSRGGAMNPSDLNRLVASNLAVTNALKTVLSAVQSLTSQGVVMSKALDDLTASVQNSISVEEKAVTLLQGVSARLAAAGTDPVALTQLKTDLDKGTADLAAAIAAGSDQPPATQAPPTA